MTTLSEGVAGREMDARVAREVMGLDVRGEAFAIHVEGEWSVRGEGDPEGWMCYAGTEPVYRREGGSYYTEPPTLGDELGLMKYGATREDCERRFAERLAEWERDHERWGCHHYDLDVVPLYSTDIDAAWEVVEKMRAAGWLVIVEGHPDEWCVHTYHDEDAFIDCATADSAPLAICRAALQALRTPSDSVVGP